MKPLKHLNFSVRYAKNHQKIHQGQSTDQKRKKIKTNNDQSDPSDQRSMATKRMITPRIGSSGAWTTWAKTDPPWNPAVGEGAIALSAISDAMGGRREAADEVDWPLRCLPRVLNLRSADRCAEPSRTLASSIADILSCAPRRASCERESARPLGAPGL